MTEHETEQDITYRTEYKTEQIREYMIMTEHETEQNTTPDGTQSGTDQEIREYDKTWHGTIQTQTIITNNGTKCYLKNETKVLKYGTIFIPFRLLEIGKIFYS